MNSKEFNMIVYEEKRLYLGDNPQKTKQMKKSRHKRYYIWEYLYYFRCCQYYRDVRQDNNSGRFERKLAKYRFRYYEKKKNIYSYKSGVEIGLDSRIGKNCDIWHSGVVINGNIGDNCVFHGNNTVGNKGIGNDSLRPNLGNNVDLGVGAIVIGGLDIADNCIIGAGAVVTKSFEKQGSIIIGVPGKIINQDK